MAVLQAKKMPLVVVEKVQGGVGQGMEVEEQVQ